MGEVVLDPNFGAVVVVDNIRAIVLSTPELWLNGDKDPEANFKIVKEGFNPEYIKAKYIKGNLK